MESQIPPNSNAMHNPSPSQAPPLPPPAVGGARRPVWNVERHRRFVQIVHNLGIETALPEQILEQMSDVDGGMTLEAVASHLRTYRIFLRRRSHLHVQHQLSSLRIE